VNWEKSLNRAVKRLKACGIEAVATANTDERPGLSLIIGGARVLVERPAAELFATVIEGLCVVRDKDGNRIFSDLSDWG